MVGQMVVLKILGQPHSSVIVCSSIQSGRRQAPARLGQVEPIVSVIVTQVGDPEGVIESPRMRLGQVTMTAVRQASFKSRISQRDRLRKRICEAPVDDVLLKQKAVEGCLLNLDFTHAANFKRWRKMM
jgi:hypothetical protein